MIEFLKDLFGGQALTFEQLSQAINNYNTEHPTAALNVANLAEGKYISVDKYNAKVKELDTANGQIATLNQTVKTHEGDKNALNQKIKDMQKDYDKKIKNMKVGYVKDSAINQWFSEHKTKYADLLKGKFDMEKVVVSDDFGTVSGLEEQGKTLLEQYKDLFTPTVSGKTPANPNDQTGAQKDPSKMTYDDFVELENNK